MAIAKIKYSCKCKSVEVPIEELPGWPWISSGDKFCVKCHLTIQTDFIEEGEENGNSKNTNEVKS